MRKNTVSIDRWCHGHVVRVFGSYSEAKDLWSLVSTIDGSAKPFEKRTSTGVFDEARDMIERAFAHALQTMTG